MLGAAAMEVHYVLRSLRCSCWNCVGIVFSCRLERHHVGSRFDKIVFAGSTGGDGQLKATLSIARRLSRLRVNLVIRIAVCVCVCVGGAGLAVRVCLCVRGCVVCGSWFVCVCRCRVHVQPPLSYIVT